jgi:hypothetical protein
MTKVVGSLRGGPAILPETAVATLEDPLCSRSVPQVNEPRNGSRTRAQARITPLLRSTTNLVK